MEKKILELRRILSEAEKDEENRARKRGLSMSARGRILYLLDDGTFFELFKFAKTQCKEFGMEKKAVLGDGVVVGYGKIDGRTVFVFSQDRTVMGGSAGKVHGQKIVNVLRLAREVKAPVVGLYDSSGARIQEGVENVLGFGEIFFENSLNSGFVPQICAIMGTCTGGAVYSPALCDFIIQLKGASMFITGPRVVKEVTGEDVTFEDLGGERIHTQISGVSHFLAEDEKSCLDLIKELLSYLPQNCFESPKKVFVDDDPKRETDMLSKIVPSSPKKTYDMHDVIYEIVDGGKFLEVQKDFAKNIIIGFCRFCGMSCGIVANQPKVLGGAIDVDASSKAARFIRFLDAFNIPIVNLVDVPGYMPGTRQEHGGIIKHGAKMLYAYSESTVPKVTIVLRKAYGGSIPGMCCKQTGADQMFLWPTAELAMMGEEAACEVIYKKEIEKSKNPREFKENKAKEYRERFLNPYYPSERMLVDGIIEPKDTRKVIIDSLFMLSKKDIKRPRKKHGNPPL